MLELRGVHAVYGLSHVLHGVTLTAREGEVISLLGRNGAGKSTTLKAMMGLVRVTAGAVALLGRSLLGLAPVVVRRLGDAITALKRDGLTIVLSEQNVKFARRLADRAYIIEKGEIKFEGPMTALDADEPLRRAYLGV